MYLWHYLQGNAFFKTDKPFKHVQEPELIDGKQRLYQHTTSIIHKYEY